MKMLEIVMMLYLLLPVDKNAATSDEDWDYLYKDYWRDNITDKIRDIDPNINWTPWYDPVTQTGYPADTAAINQILSQPQYIDSLYVWHQQTAEYANTVYVPFGSESFYKVGTNRFDSLKNEITSKASVLNGGSKILINPLFITFMVRRRGILIFVKSLWVETEEYTPQNLVDLCSATLEVM